jgi:broad specificity phosphatase PhoE
VLDEFDEFQGDVVLERSLPRLAETNSHIRDLEYAVRNANSPPQRRRNFQKLFEAVVTMWVNGEVSVNGAESWEAFIARVNRGLSQFLSTANKSETCAIFTSGGPIAVAVQRALRLSPHDTLQVAWMPRNCSYSEFLFAGDRFTLSTFNSFQHLDDPALLTYR